MSKPKTNKLAKRIAIGMMAVFVLVCVWAYISVKSIPEWYMPVQVTPQEYPDIRDEITEASRVLNNSMQRIEPFEYQVTEQQVNRWLNSAEALDPRYKGFWPPSVQSPVVAFHNGQVSGGALLDFKGRQTIANITLSVELFGDQIAVNIASFCAGKLPLPRSLIIQQLQNLLDAQRPKVRQQMLAIIEGQAVENRFPFPNSDYDFKVINIDFANGTATVGIQPLEKEKNAKNRSKSSSDE